MERTLTYEVKSACSPTILLEGTYSVFKGQFVRNAAKDEVMCEPEEWLSLLPRSVELR